MFQEYRVTYMSGNEWKLPLNLALGFHLIVALSAIYLPDIIDSKPKFEDIYTVNLVNLNEVMQPEPRIEEPPVQEAVKEPETVPENAVSIAEPAPEPVAAPPKAISIKPLKRKKKKKVIQPPPKQKTNLEALKRQKLAEMIRAQQQADEQARILAQEAELERKMLEEAKRKRAAATSKQPARKPGGSSGGKQINSAVAKQYYTAIRSRLMSLWSLPEYKVWDPSLNAQVVITIHKNGVIANSFFEKKSGDRMFDSFVTKTLQDVGTLPPIPPAMKKQRLEIGLRFTPEQIR